ncbi:MAG: choice-of-anchor D domain-containing protein [Acidobacteriaceae bacterium]|nr:choice-of-anchor D domain-containing protein [Acidobacteriaceae bacterium]
MLLWTSDAGNGGNGPVRVTFASAMAGAGASLQADGPGAFTAKIEAFNGSTSLGYFTASSSQGRPVYLGVLDQSGPHITSVVFSLVSVTQGITTDFGLDTVSLTSALAAPAVSLSPTSLKFATQLIKTTSAAQVLTLKNTGTASLNITSIAVSGDFARATTCGATLAAGASCTISVTFHPTGRGNRTGAITVTDNAPGSPHTVSLSGTGTAVKLSAAKLTFPATTVGKSSTPQTVTVTNVDITALSITSIGLTGTNATSFTETNNCKTSVPGGGSCSITVTFQPKAKGTLNADVTINDNGGASPEQIALTGTGQ